MSARDMPWAVPAKISRNAESRKCWEKEKIINTAGKENMAKIRSQPFFENFCIEAVIKDPISDPKPMAAMS